MISVALCTYNGERFLAQQLASIAAQTRPPDELVVRDDGSADGTAELVRRFADAAPFPVHLAVHPTTVGSTANFATAIAACRGEVICLADQDDVWVPHKLEIIEKLFQENPAAGLVFSDADMVDADLRPLGHRLFDSIRFGRTERERFRAGGAFPLLLRRDRVCGATMGFRSNWRELILPIPGEWVHDAWIALLIAAAAPCLVSDEPLIRYRQHGGQQIGAAKRGLYARYLLGRQMSRAAFEATARRFTQARDRLGRFPGVSADDLRRLGAKVAHCERRATMRAADRSRVRGVLGEAVNGRYFRYSSGWKSIAQDLFLP
jgi:glycosyltransferase involved in cell wall biosynthesis